MKNNQARKYFGGLVFSLVAAIFAPALLGWHELQASPTDVAPVPIFTSTTASTEVKPNVMFVLDDSGSMDWGYMPDAAENFAGRLGFASAHCNGVYYDPSINYKVPLKADGSSYPDASFTGAWVNGYNTGAGTVNLSTNFNINNNFSVNDSSYVNGTAFYYDYSGTQITPKQKDYINTNSIFYKECNSATTSTTKVDGVNPVNTLFTRKTVSSTSGPSGTDERKNFANWYSYYRTRMQTMKTSSGRAFSSINNHYRVGFMSINNNVDPLNILDFDSTQKASWYSRLYSTTPNNSTPLRTALSNAGRLYAGKLTSLGGVTMNDPVQYSCQQNYTILSTDGYWNGGGGVKLNGSDAMDNQDGSLARYYNDGATGSVTTVTPYVSTQDRKAVTTGITTTKAYSKTNYTIGATCSIAGSTTPPPNTANAPMNIGNSRTGELRLSTNNPNTSNPSRCYNMGSNAWFCRTGLSPAGTSSVTDATGKKWYLVSNGATASGCKSAYTALGTAYLTNAGVCPAVTVAAVTGKFVTSTPYTQTQTLSGGTTTQVDKYTATQTTTQVVTNGVAGALGALTPDPAVFTYTSNVSSTSTPNDSDVTSTWSAGAATTSCVSNASLPAAGDTVAVLTSTNTSTGTTSTTVVSSSGPTEGTPTVTNSTTGGTSDTLADTAAYYYNTNLRTSLLGNCTGPIIPPATTPTNLCLVDKVPPNGLDTARHQHMTTFTLGLGARGRMVFSSTYLTDASGDFFDVYKGNTKGSTNCSWTDALNVTGGPCNWPVPGTNSVANIDDLWHAAVNGHGNYFSATNAETLETALSSSLKVITNSPKPGTAAAAATTNPKVTQNNNSQFSSYFKSLEWSGELIKQTIDVDPNNGIPDGSVPYYNHEDPQPTAYNWSAQTRLDAKTPSTRKIYTKGSTGLINFTWASLSSEGLQSYFTAPHISTTPPLFPVALTGLSQFCAAGVDCISSTAQTNTTVATGGAAGEALVNFIRGERANEEGVVTEPAKFFRHRTHVLGDIVSAQPQYVGPPEKSYDEALNPGYAAFKDTYKTRDAVVYAAANDGMLHAFDALTGEEKWAYIPSYVLPRLYTLADKNYADKHQYFVEGTPKISDAYIDGAWKTILVGGLNGGGTGFYALNITDPANPTLLWEYTNANMGYSFGNPEITKLDDANGTWVVLLTSGYNNCPSSTTNCVKNSVGDGKGHLYVLNAATGALVSASADISTGEGTTTDPSGLAKIFAQTPSGTKNNVTKRVYGGDLQGNLWRFTIGSGGYSKQRLATFKDALGNPQPITSRPQVTTYNGKPIVYVGTGRYLGTTDVPSTQQQSYYAIKDELGTTDYGNPRANTTNFIRKTAVAGTCPTGAPIDVCDVNTQVRTVTQENGVASDSLYNTKGWLVDFPVNSGEINFTDSKLALGTLVFSTSVPKASTSEVCGAVTEAEPVSFGYMLNFLTGGAVGTSSVIGSTLGVGIATAPQLIQLPDGRIIAKYRLSDGQEVTSDVRVDPPGSDPGRVSWREILAD